MNCRIKLFYSELKLIDVKSIGKNKIIQFFILYFDLFGIMVFLNLLW